MNQYTVAVDFDHTIHNPEDRADGYRMGRPYDGAKEALQRLRDLGLRIVIHTCRARAPQGEPDPHGLPYTGSADHVEDWLNYFGIPFDEVTALKPAAIAYVDDRAVPFQGDWHLAALEVQSMLYAEEHFE